MYQMTYVVCAWSPSPSKYKTFSRYNEYIIFADHLCNILFQDTYRKFKISLIQKVREKACAVSLPKTIVIKSNEDFTDWFRKGGNHHFLASHVSMIPVITQSLLNVRDVYIWCVPVPASKEWRPYPLESKNLFLDTMNI